MVYLQRPGNQAQMSLLTATPAAPDGAVRALVEHIATHPDDDLSTAALAARAGVTNRTQGRSGQLPGRNCVVGRARSARWA
ncbi:hypothetical protein ACWGE1_23810 [Streptomyces sp. NPDC054932]